MSLDPCVCVCIGTRQSFRIMMFWNSDDDQGSFFLANSFLKGQQMLLEATKSFFLSIPLHWKKIKRWEWLHCVCIIKTHWLICNMAYLGPNVTLTCGQILTCHFKSQNISLEAPLWEKHDDAIAIYLYLLVPKLFVKEHFARNSYFGNLCDMWRHINRRPEVTFDEDLVGRRI